MAGDNWFSQISGRYYGSDFHFQLTEYYEPKRDQILAAVNRAFNYLKDSLTERFSRHKDPADVITAGALPIVSNEPITQAYNLGDIDLGEEIVGRIETVAVLREIREAEGEKPIDGSDVQDGWARSNYFRDLIKKYGFEEACNRYLALPVNMRYHSYQKDEDVRGFARLGVITDPRNGFVNLRELQELKENKGKLAAKRLELMALREKAMAKGNENQVEAITYALRQLQDIDATIGERKKILQDQFLQLVAVQAVANEEKLDGDTFTLIHLALLNPKKHHFDQTGWMHDERNEMLDMAEIFKAFEGKKLVLDGTGPRVDKEGNIHLAIDREGKEMTLNPIFCNVSTQGHYKNDGVQREINERAFEKLKEYGLGWRLAKCLIGDKSNYQIAEDLGTMLWKIEPFSTGCLSAKDRTGIVAERLVLRKVRGELEEQVSQKKVDRSLAQRYSYNLARKILDRDAPATRVVRENTGAEVLKIHLTAPVPEMSLFERVSYLYRQITSLV